MNLSQKYILLVIAGLAPSLSGCLDHFRLKADVDYDASSAEVEDSKESPAPKDENEGL